MTLRRISLSLICCFLMVAAFGPGKLQAAATDTPGQVSQSQALKAAAAHIVNELKVDEKSKWLGKAIQVKKAQKVYDVNGELIAYTIDVLANGHPSGYVMVSAQLDEEDPILMWEEEGQAPKPGDFNPGLDATTIRSKELVWLGGVAFAARYDLTGGESLFATFKEAGGIAKKMELTADINKLPGWRRTPSKENRAARNAWEFLDRSTGGLDLYNPTDGVTNVNPDNWETGYTSVDNKYISKMDGINQKQWQYSGINWTGCAPTAASNIMLYWSQQGYPSLNPTSSQTDIVMSLRTYFGTTQDPNTGAGSTTTSNVPTGMKQYAKAKGYSAADSGNTSLIWANATQEVKMGRPWLLHVWGNTYFGTSGHTITGVGYKEFKKCETIGCGSTQYFVVRNNWADERDQYGNLTHNLYVKVGTWTSATNTWFYPILTSIPL